MTDSKLNNLDTSNVEFTNIWTDGACTRNGHPNARAGAGVFFGKNDLRNANFTVPGKQTNQRAEVWAAWKALELTKENKNSPVCIITDSLYTINCATGKWNIKANQDLLLPLKEACENRYVIFKHIKGHSGDYGNTCADDLAVKASHGKYV